MSGKKIISLIIGAVFLSVSLNCVAGAVELSGNIEAEIVETLGLVKPRIKLDENQTGLTLNTEFYPDTNYTMVNDTLRINIDVIDNSGKDNFLIPRFVFTSVFIMRDIKSIPLLPLMKLDLFRKGLPPLLVRILPTYNLFQRIDITENTSNDYYFNVSMNYWLGNATNFISSENLTMHIITMGFFPGDINGISSEIKFVDHKVINLKEVEYI